MRLVRHARRVRRSTWLLAAVVVGQVATCATTARIAIVAPPVAVLGACDALPLGETWCAPPRQGTRDPGAIIAVLALGTLAATALAWLLPGMLLIARVDDWRRDEAR